MNQSDKDPDQAGQDSALQCLMMMARLHGIAADPAQLQHQFGREPFTLDKLLLGARALGMSARCITQDRKRLERTPLPAIGVDRQGRYFILAKLEQGQARDWGSLRILIQRPGQPPQVLSRRDFESLWSGRVILLTSKASYTGESARFDFSWFIPAVIKYRKVLVEVLVISLVLQLLGLVTPLFFQVVMDKVLVNHAMMTLNVVAVALVAATLFEAALTGIRTAVFAHTSSKIDVELGSRLFAHLLSLPIGYFQVRRAGDSIARIRELENIRSFLTSNALTLVLDIIFSFIFLGVMLCYSVTLSLIVLASIPLYLALSLVFTPMLRARLNDKFNKNAENQSFLVETLTGMDTVKSMAVEPRWQQRWDKQLAAYVAASLGSTNIGLLASGGVTLVSKLVTVGIMWLGALLVVKNELTVGELVAFNMLAGQVASPILRMAQLWNDFQQVGISMSRLADVLDARAEVGGNRTRLPQVSGAISFDQVSFRYRPESPPVIHSVSLEIAPGEVIGVVGRSGSGKSTLARLVQRLYLCDGGRISVDGQDIAVIDTASLRRQIGVVLQESTLFSRSIRDNIALADPALPIEDIIAAARLAGAHDFICELPEGYDTVVGEQGSGLSGGQRQRIAIARALITNPGILIFDEATSALDYESEKIIQDNMRQICAGRTVLIIAHRLSAVRDADRIVVMEQGRIAESGPHAELLARPDGIYAHLYGLQSQQASPAVAGTALSAGGAA
ncbi:type I secretion system permease/ATPase [Herbaspirillum frisingense]|uniref:type I secretion system permease/ATPase n=1 Tax=Herbaspirillum frisingense TaxID=92645 RepID=UPI0016023C12|nr:type I secretion system permease/ATPase [Herbaspirillum frisingense]QNB07948.1 type I secretion system permease/ATPase [Herbaspirillum frisingense]